MASKNVYGQFWEPYGSSDESHSELAAQLVNRETSAAALFYVSVYV